MSDLSGASELGVSFMDHEGEAATAVSVDLAKVNRRVKKLAADQSADIEERLIAAAERCAAPAFEHGEFERSAGLLGAIASRARLPRA